MSKKCLKSCKVGDILTIYLQLNPMIYDQTLSNYETQFTYDYKVVDVDTHGPSIMFKGREITIRNSKIKKILKKNQ